MNNRRAGDLPRYVLRKLVRGIGYAYYFNMPMWARKKGCPVKSASRASSQKPSRLKIYAVLDEYSRADFDRLHSRCF
jgi:hypothetical protein